ncbi:MAG: hypothetical protein IJD31_07380 [Lachnospiraceae bacterium]|nr:hypothetical protein [Lachnospiraceae bacterium]
MQEKKQTKVPMEVQFDNSNLKDYSEKDLVKMVNSTKGNEDFKAAYPEATFTRELAYKYLQAKYDMDYIPHGLVVPHGVTIDDLLDAYKKQNCAGDDSKEMQSDVGNIYTSDIVRVAMNEKKKRKTLSMNAGTMQRWEEFTKDYSNKGDYLSAACDLFMKKFESGKIEMEPDWGIHRD